MIGRRAQRVLRALGCVALLGVLVAWVLPPQRVVQELVRLRATRPPLRVETVLIEGERNWPEAVSFDLHPEYGVRVSGDRDGRWLFIGGHPVAGVSARIPAWLPDLSGLVLREEEALLAWLEFLGVDPERSQLARCGDADCFVLGGRDGPAQVWVDKERFEIKRVVSSDGRVVEFEEYTDWGGLRFPRTLRVGTRAGPVATLEIVRADRASGLSPKDFALEWVFGSESPRSDP